MRTLDEDNEIIPLEDRGIFLFTGEVSDEKCEDAIRWILEHNFEGKNESLTMLVNSQGGYVTSGFAVVDTMAGSKLPISTVGLGVIASMGLLIFIAGEKGKRILTPNTLIMSHQFSGFFEGKEHELVAGIRQNNLISEMITRHLKKHTGLSVNKIKKYLLPPSDVYLSAKEAKALNLCDEIRLSYE